MALIQVVVLAFGGIYLVVGLLGFVPPLHTPPPWGVVGPFAGNILGLLAINWLHNLIHVATGLSAILASQSLPASRAYALVLGSAYTAIFFFGHLQVDIATLGGLLPLDLSDDALHLLTAATFFSAYLVSAGGETQRPHPSNQER